MRRARIQLRVLLPLMLVSLIIFAMRYGPADPNACLRQELFGKPSPVTLDVGSDHYGVLDTYTTDGSNC